MASEVKVAYCGKGLELHDRHDGLADKHNADADQTYIAGLQESAVLPRDLARVSWLVYGETYDTDAPAWLIRIAPMQINPTYTYFKKAPSFS